MTGKGNTVKGSAKGIRYIRDDKGQAIEIDRNNLLGEDSKELYWEMRSTANQNTHTQNAFFSGFFSPQSKYTKEWGTDQWKGLSDEIVERLGLNGNQYMVTLHTSTRTPHLHIYANRIDLHGVNRLQAHQISVQCQKIAESIARERGWETAKEAGRNKSANRAVQSIRADLQGCIEGSGSRDELTRAMKEKGYRLDWNERNGQVIGLRITHEASERQFNASHHHGLKPPGIDGSYKLSQIDRSLKVGDILKQLQPGLTKGISSVAEKVLEKVKFRDKGMEM